MNAEIVAKTRRTSLVTTFGVGSLLPAQDDSVMICGLDEWPKGDVIAEPRLAEAWVSWSSAARALGARAGATCQR